MENPIIKCDFPDPDVIRVKDTYYMISTTMHFMPGGVILRSKDLLYWEFASYVYDVLEDTQEARLENGENIYGKGMWAASLRFHEGLFYVCFVANDTQKTYLFTSKLIEGPWQKSEIEGFYHDCSLLFDEGKCYIVYGNLNIYLTELEADLSRPKEGGLHRIIVREKENVVLGYEGSHIYKINGKYYLFLIHWLAEGTKRRTQSCFVSDSLSGEFVGKDVLDDDMGYFNQGVAQGGIVDTPEGDWYAILFQDTGAVGRIPILVPIHFENDFPIFGCEGKVPHKLSSDETVNSIKSFATSDDFYYLAPKLKPAWQWNHIPDNKLWSVTDLPGTLQITTDKTCSNLCEAKNVLTQRMMFPSCTVQVTIDGSKLNDGDYAGTCALQGEYGWIALTKEDGKYYIVMHGKSGTEEYEQVLVSTPHIQCKVQADFTNMKDEVQFFYCVKDDIWHPLGPVHKLHFKLDHFTGCRVGLFLFSTKKINGSVGFSKFIYEYGGNK